MDIHLLEARRRFLKQAAAVPLLVATSSLFPTAFAENPPGSDASLISDEFARFDAGTWHIVEMTNGTVTPDYIDPSKNCAIYGYELTFSGSFDFKPRIPAGAKPVPTYNLIILARRLTMAADCTFNFSGLDGTAPPSRVDGGAAGAPGANGGAGDAGQNAGHLLMIAEKIAGSLHVSCLGGNGGAGQDGGWGMKGATGQPGAAGWQPGQGQPGLPGGAAASGGPGGAAGKAGSVQIYIIGSDQRLGTINVDSHDGNVGPGGQIGKAGAQGDRGPNGQYIPLPSMRHQVY